MKVKVTIEQDIPNSLYCIGQKNSATEKGD